MISATTFGPGMGGRVTVRVSDTLTITGSNPNSGVASGIGSLAGVRSDAAGDVFVEAKVLTLSEGGAISSRQIGSGASGDVTVRVSDVLTITGSDPASGASSGIGAQALGLSSSAGDVLVEARVVSLSDNGGISSSTFGSGTGGRVTVRVSDTLTMTGGVITAQQASSSSGAAGDVLVEAGVVTLMDGGQISGSTFGSGQGGNVTVSVSDTLTIRGSDAMDMAPSGIFAQSGSSSGAAGDLLVMARILTLADGGVVSGNTSGSGAGGRVTVEVSDTLTITGSDPVSGVTSSIAGSSSGRGRGGDLTIRTRELQLFDGAEITANANDIGNAGNIRIDVTQLLRVDQSEIRTNALRADGGNIDITANVVQLREGRINTSVGDGDGSGGNITIDTNLGLLERSEIRADAFGGPGGNITIRSNGLITDVNSQVSASSEQDVDGTVDIQGLIDLSGSLTAIDPGFASSAVLRSDPCIGRLRGEGVSRFIVAGRTRIPIEPGGLLPSPSGQITIAAGGQPTQQQAAPLHDAPPRPASTLACLFKGIEPDPTSRH